jgi:hypothetical protein
VVSFHDSGRGGEGLRPHLRGGPSAIGRGALKHPCQEEVARVIDGDGGNRQVPDEAPMRGDTPVDGHVVQRLIVRLGGPREGRERHRHHHRDQRRHQPSSRHGLSLRVSAPP